MVARRVYSAALLFAGVASMSLLGGCAKDCTCGPKATTELRTPMKASIQRPVYLNNTVADETHPNSGDTQYINLYTGERPM